MVVTLHMCVLVCLYSSVSAFRYELSSLINVCVFVCLDDVAIYLM